jgi:hypothetical protein
LLLLSVFSISELVIVAVPLSQFSLCIPLFIIHKPTLRKIILPKPKLSGKRRPTTKIKALEQPGEMGGRGLGGA